MSLNLGRDLLVNKPSHDLSPDFSEYSPWTESHLRLGPGPSHVTFTKENHRDSLVVSLVT